MSLYVANVQQRTYVSCISVVPTLRVAKKLRWVYCRVVLMCLQILTAVLHD